MQEYLLGAHSPQNYYVEGTFPRYLMIATRVRWRTGIGVAAMMAALGLVATMATPVPAEAGVAVGFGFGLTATRFGAIV